MWVLGLELSDMQVNHQVVIRLTFDQRHSLARRILSMSIHETPCSLTPGQEIPEATLGGALHVTDHSAKGYPPTSGFVVQ